MFIPIMGRSSSGLESVQEISWRLKILFVNNNKDVVLLQVKTSKLVRFIYAYCSSMIIVYLCEPDFKSDLHFSLRA